MRCVTILALLAPSLVGALGAAAAHGGVLSADDGCSAASGQSSGLCGVHMLQRGTQKQQRGQTEQSARGGRRAKAPGLGRSGIPSFSAALVGLDVAERRARVMPLAWLHVPKCGTTIGNALIKLPGACPGLPESAWLCSESNQECMPEVFFEETGQTVGPDDYNFNRPPHICSGIARWSWHTGFNAQYESVKGQAMTMLRQPEQRLISASRFYCSMSEYYCQGARWYAQTFQGLAVKMLTRDSEDPNALDETEIPTVHETKLAVRRLREGFAYVGLTEEYELSICLFHAMFGGPCDGHELGVYHPGPAHTSEPYDVKVLGGFRDISDGALYEEAKRIFFENLRLYNVSASTCEPCFRQAGIA